MITFRRLYHVSSASYNYRKLGVKLNKLINPRPKREWHQSRVESDIMPSVKSLTKTEREPGKRSIRRSAMLNKLFMKHITDMMSTGTVAIDIVGRGIEVSKAKITPDLQKVLVFWVCKGDSSDAETEAVLARIAGPLRHELSTLRVMGEVPYIEFVKDHQEALIVDLDRRLCSADYGEDYTPTDMGHLLKTEFTLTTKISPEMKAKIKQMEEEIPLIEEPIPEMTHSVFGLDHEKILNRLMTSRKKSKDAWSKLDDDSNVISYRTEGVEKSDVDVGSQKKELADFLLKRKVLQNKIHREMRKTNENWQLELHSEDEPNKYIDESYYDEEFEENEDYFYEHDFKTSRDKNENNLAK